MTEERKHNKNGLEKFIFAGRVVLDLFNLTPEQAASLDNFNTLWSEGLKRLKENGSLTPDAEDKLNEMVRSIEPEGARISDRIADCLELVRLSPNS